MRQEIGNGSKFQLHFALLELLIICASPMELFQNFFNFYTVKLFFNLHDVVIHLKAQSCTLMPKNP